MTEPLDDEEIWAMIESEKQNQTAHPEAYYTAYEKGRCSPLCDGHCIQFLKVNP